jgi:uncharacterized protein YbaP (TraB family)
MPFFNAVKWWISATVFIVAIFAVRPEACAEDAPPVPECKGRDLLADLKIKDPGAYDRWIAAARRTPNGQAVFWRVTGKDLPQPSWLLGTAHVTDPRILALPSETNNAFEKARILAVEIENLDKPWIDYFNNLSALPFYYLPDGKTWRDYLSTAELELMKTELAQHGGWVAQFERLQPWAIVLITFSYPNCEVWRISLGRNFLDAELTSRARRSGKPIIGLETRYEALGTIARTPLEAQFRKMLTYARIYGSPEDEYETSIQIYLSRLNTLYVSFEESPFELNADELKAFREFDHHALDERNLIMRDRALPLIREGNAFIAVGAAHLPGDQGLVELFRKAGYEVTPVN